MQLLTQILFQFSNTDLVTFKNDNIVHIKNQDRCWWKIVVYKNNIIKGKTLETVPKHNETKSIKLDMR